MTRIHSNKVLSASNGKSSRIEARWEFLAAGVDHIRLRHQDRFQLNAAWAVPNNQLTHNCLIVNQKIVTRAPLVTDMFLTSTDWMNKVS